MKNFNSETVSGNELIARQKMEIKKLAGEKELLLHELHHRVRNNMQIIYSMLRLQSRQLKDPVAVTAIKGNIHRVWAMALIHHKLYQNENLAQIDMPQYINELSANILETNTKAEQQISLKHDIQNINLEADVAIPLGLIINELLSHVLKQNYNGIPDPELKITLTEKNNEGLILLVQSNGKDISTNVDNMPSGDFGMELVYMLTKQLKGKLENINRDGTCYKLTIYCYK
ncbi:MAG: sensor histidine kinase [Bacteroidales bacterium]|nr:sensor histidine kinase [Bacteroidales bacterium]